MKKCSKTTMLSPEVNHTKWFKAKGKNETGHKKTFRDEEVNLFGSKVKIDVKTISGVGSGGEGFCFHPLCLSVKKNNVKFLHFEFTK